MAKPSYEELDQMYRSALRQIVQLKHTAETLERRLLAEGSRHRQAAQAIDLSIEEFRRDMQDQDTGRAIERVAQTSLPRVDLSTIESHRSETRTNRGTHGQN